MTTATTTATATSGAEAVEAATAAAAASAAAAAKATAAPPADAEMTAACSSSSDDDESDNESNSSSSRSLPWLLGFVEPPTSALSLLRHHFRSKVGGRPAWLDPCALPTPAQLSCGVTGAPLEFLCQVYAPLDESSDESDDDDDEDDDEATKRRGRRNRNKHEDAFHRAVFVFVGPSGSAMGKSNDPSVGNRSIRAFRCQLPRENEHYSPRPPPREGCPPPRLVDVSAVTNADRWRVAECEASIVAAAAEAAAAAGGAGQIAAAFAKGGGGTGGGAGAGAGASPPLRLFPEAELVVEEEGSDCGSDLEEAVAAAERAMKTTSTTTRKAAAADAAAAAAAPPTPAQKPGGGREQQQEEEEETTAAEEEEADAEMMDSVEAAVHPDASAMARFAARVARAPSQVLRYRFDRKRQKQKQKSSSKNEGGTIWPRASPKPPSAVPPCFNCGAPRALEFQLLPQMLNFLGCDAADEEAPDWSCVGVWSCVESCSKKEGGEGGASSSSLVLPPVSKTGGAGISGGPSAYIEEFVWVQPSDAQQGSS